MSEALRLSDSLCRMDTFTEYQRGEILKAAAELTRLAPMEAELQQARAKIDELEHLCDTTYVASGADAYNHACDEMERWQKDRAEAGKEIGTEGSLCDGIAWLYKHVAGVESELQQAREERTALLVNEQNLREELAALRASLSKPVGFASDLDRPSPRFVTDLKFCTIAEHEAGNHTKYIPLFAIKDTK